MQELNKKKYSVEGCER